MKADDRLLEEDKALKLLEASRRLHYSLDKSTIESFRHVFAKIAEYSEGMEARGCG